MTAPALTITTIEPHTCEWRARAERAEQRVAELSLELNELQAWEERRRKYDDIPNQALSAKAVRLAVHLDKEKRKWEAEGKTGPQRIDLEKLGADIGFGRKACEGALGELDRVEHTSVLRGEPEEIEITTKKGRRTIEISPYLIEPLGRDPDELHLGVDRNHGGRRCRSCPKGTGVHLEQEPDKIEIIKRTKKSAKIICDGCGECLGRTTHTTEEPLRQPRFRDNKQPASSPDSAEFQIEIEERSRLAERPAPEIAAPVPLGTINPIGGGSIHPPNKQPETPADFLAAIAGTEERHIEMQPAGEHKYEKRSGPITPALAEEHMAGRLCLGGSLKHAGGMARAFLFDGDTPETIAILQRSAVTLAAAGAKPVLISSPSREHEGSRHLLIVVDRLTVAAAGRATILHHAPELREIKEYWPRPTWPPVRLPGAYYQRPDAEGWCDLWAPGGVHRTGAEAIEFLMQRQTPASWVTESPEDPPEPPRPDRPARDADSAQLVPVTAPHALPIAGQDPVWIRLYGANRDRLPYWITDGQAAAYFNARHEVADLLPLERNGYGLASWRGEDTASVMLYPETNTWADFGNGVGRNGHRDGGDAFELHCRLAGTTRRAALAAVVNEMRREADRILVNAGRSGQIPAWVAAITSPAGWARAEAQWKRPPYQVSA